MKNLSYCSDCRRISDFNGVCSYCQSTNIKELKRKAPVGVMNAKIKGTVHNVMDNTVEIVHVDGKTRSLKKFEAEKLIKIL
jgi:carbon monoxide dehydrogenase subunit G